MDIQSESKDLHKILGQINNYNSLRTLSIILIPIIIGIFLYIHCNNKLKELEKQKSNILINIIKLVADQAKYAKSAVDEIREKDTYLIFQNQKKINDNLDIGLKIINEILSFKILLPDNIHSAITDSQLKLIDIQKQVNDFNEQFVDRRINEYDYLFKKSPFQLDENQKRAVIIDDKHNLVVAGAGSGKTEVLITRIAYLIERKPDTINSERIVALAFQSKAADEMKERLRERYGFEVKIKTFHALGKEILEKSSNNPPKLLFQGDNYEAHYKKFIGAQYKLLQRDENFRLALIEYMKYFGDEEKTEVDFTNKKEYFEYMRLLKYTALNGTKVKSHAERQILNFLLTHSINGEPILIEYEKPAEWMKFTNEKGST